MIKVLWNHFAENNLILAVSIICIGETYANLFFDEVQPYRTSERLDLLKSKSIAGGNFGNDFVDKIIFGDNAGGFGAPIAPRRHSGFHLLIARRQRDIGLVIG